MTVQVEQRAFTVAEYYRMAEAGILSPEDRVELVEGRVVRMSPIGVRHAACVRRLTELFSKQAEGIAVVSVQNPVRLDDYSEPQPDVALLRWREDFYARAHPVPGDVLLIVEVADTSEEYDRQVKVPAYARAGIPEVWVINLEKEWAEVYARPVGGVYRYCRQVEAGEVATVQGLPAIAVAVEAFLGSGHGK